LYEYDAWGNCTEKLLNISGSNNYARNNPFRYRGYYLDAETSLYYLQTRYYDPEIGCFINADGCIYRGAYMLFHNVYTYSENNSIIYKCQFRRVIVMANKKKILVLSILNCCFLLFSIILLVSVFSIDNDQLQMIVALLWVLSIVVIIIVSAFVLSYLFRCRYGDDRILLSFGSYIYKTIYYNDIKMVGIVKAVDGRSAEIKDKNRKKAVVIACYESNNFLNKKAVMTPFDSIIGTRSDLCHSFYSCEDIIVLLSKTDVPVIITSEIWKDHSQELISDLIEYKNRVFVEVENNTGLPNKLLSLIRFVQNK